MSAELGGAQISSLLEALPGIASVLRSPLADALVKAIRAAGGGGPFAFDVPALTSQAQQQPQNPTIQFRLGAALAAAGRCDTASVVARAGLALEPDNVLGPLVLGACREQADRYDEAVAIYTDFAAQHPNARGVAALRAKTQLARRAAAGRACRQAPARAGEPC